MVKKAVEKVVCCSLMVSTSRQCQLTLLSLTMAGAFLSQSPYSHSAGLSLVDFNSVSAFGSAGAGRGVNKADASVISTNPAGMAFLGQRQFVIGGMGVFAGGDAIGAYVSPYIEDHLPDVADYSGYFGWIEDYRPCSDLSLGEICYTETGKKVDDFLNPAFVPSLYYAQPVTDNLWAGLGVYAAFGGETHYPIEAPFRYQALDSTMRVVNVQPSLSWKLNDQLAVGVGAWIAAGHMDMSRHLNPWTAAPVDGVAEIDGDGIGFGMNLGVIWKPTPSLTTGISYHSQTRIKFEGDVKANGVAGLHAVLNQFADDQEYPVPIPEADASAKWVLDHRPGTIEEDSKMILHFPEHVDLSLAWDLDHEWTLLATGVWTRWSRFEYLKVESKGGPASDIVSVSNGAPGQHVLAKVPLDWDDVWSFSVGTLWKYSPALTLRAGYAWDTSPTRNSNRGARIPDNDRQWLTLGGSYTFNDTYSLDVAYGYMWMKSFSVFDVNHRVDSSRQGIGPTAYYEDPGQLSVKYKDMHAHVLSTQLSVRF